MNQNIEKAQKEIDRLEAEAAEATAAAPPAKPSAYSGRQDKSNKVSQKDAGANVDIPAEAELDQEEDAVADVAKEMKATSIEDKENQDVATA